ncbi:hypothetical protein V2J52_08800 [Georgenia sp. MJ173]|uniref:hypothetical protein n=1 Tax=Georgenia sunbinii TaxID=3117728 RepID=UPI002F264937
MPAAIAITILAALCVAGVFAVLLVTRRPAEGWGGWLRGAYAAWRGRELTWVDADGGVDDSAVGDLGTLFLMSEPGNGYTLPPEDLEERIGIVARSRHHASDRVSAPRARPRRASHAG